MKINRLMSYLILIIIATVIIFSFILQENLLANLKFAYQPLHSALEALGGLAAIMMAIFLFQRREENYGGKYFLIAIGFMSIGILDIFHGATVPGRGFVLLQSVSTLVGSFLFALIWFPWLSSDKEMAWKKWAAMAVIAGSIFFAIWTLVARETLPVMVKNGEFTVAAIAFNLIAGVLFLAASMRFLIDFSHSGKREIYLFTCMTLFFGLSGMMFPFSVLWDSTWWMWHLLRVIACIVVLVTVVREYQLIAARLRGTLEGRMKIEESLKEANEYLENLFRYANAPIIVWDSQYNITRFNPAFEALTGRKAEDVIGNSIKILFPFDLVENSMELIRKAQQGERWETVEINILHKDDSVRTVLWNSASILAADGKTIIATMAQGQDITERINSEKALKENEEKYFYLYENAPVGIYRIRIDGSKVLEINNTACEMLGFTKEELIGQPSAIRWADPDRRNEILKIMKEFGEAKNFDADVLTKDGSRISCLLSMKMYPDEGYIEGFIVDISERKRAERELANSENKYRTLTESAQDAIFLFDSELRINFVNQQASKLLNRNQEEITGKTINEVFHGPSSEEQISSVKQVFITGENVNSIQKIPFPTGDFWLDTRFTPILDEAGKPFIVLGISRNITERKQAEEDTIRNLEREKELNLLKSRFISVISHEFRTPLTGIQSSVQLFERYGDKWDKEKKQKFFTAIYNSIRFTNLLLDDVSLIGKNDSGKIIFSPALCSIDSICSQTLNDVKSVFGQATEIDFHSEPGTISAYVDESLLRHILNNLLSNSVKYSGMEKEIRFSVLASTDTIAFTINDKGIGIPAEDLKYIFEPFHRAANAESVKGTGLGLSIVKRCVEIHKGTIEISSELNKGTTVVVKIPYMRPEKK